MSDFYSILRKSIIDRGIADSGERDEIYSQARRAMIRRLWSFNPPLEEDEIERRIAAFDVAVSDIEADVVAAFAEPEAVEPDYDEDDPPDPYLDEPAYREPAYREPVYREPAARERVSREPAARKTARRERGYDEAGYRDPDPYAEPHDEPDDRYADDYREPEPEPEPEPEERPAASKRRLPALLDPAAFGRQVREVGLYRYHEEARRVTAPQEPAYQEPAYDDEVYDDEPLDEPEPYDAPPPQPRGREVAPRRRSLPEPPPDPYEDEPGYSTKTTRPSRRQRQADRWADDSPRIPPPDDGPPGRRGKDKGKARKVGPDDERQRRKAKRPARPLSDRDKILMLLGAIGVLVLVLGGLGIYLLAPRDSGVTVDIDARHEVSDAATAVRLAAENLPIDQTFMLFDGRDPTIFETSPDNPVRFDAGSGSVRVGSSAGSAGVRALVGPGLATRLAGHDVRVIIVARSSTVAGAASMRFAYQSGVAISHWQTANLGDDYQAVALTWRVPSMRTDRGGDLLLIQPGVPGDGTGADVKSIRIDVLTK